VTHSAEFAKGLSLLSGTDFQSAVCAHLGEALIGFQTIPAQPQGDGGLDAFSHGGLHGYCCYGPDHNAFKTNRSREAMIIKKYCADLRRLLELGTKGKQLVRLPNPELGSILPQGQRLQKITLIVNSFDSHRIIGPILTKFNEYKRASACNYVSQDAEVVIQGPNELASLYGVTEVSLDRAQRRGFEKRILASARDVTIDDPRTFDKKMGVLLEIRPDRKDAIKNLAEGLRASWRTALAFEKDLSSTVPSMHESLDAARQRILRKVSTLMLTSSDPWKELSEATEIALKILGDDFKACSGGLGEDVASGEVARLIGECTIDWQQER
jgi:hypothetical protein